jgi:hypothetical protein
MTFTQKGADGHEGRFRPAANRYRRRLSKALASGIAGFALSGISLLVPEVLLKPLGIAGVFFVALSLALFFTLPRLTCPSCGKATDSGFGTFCPVCGSGALLVSRLWGTRCATCGRGLGRYKYRNYKIRFCTYCGVLLHAAGV